MTRLAVDVVEYTDPGCSWAWGSEPTLRRLRWRYGDRLRWRRVMGGLVGDMASYLDAFDPVAAASGFARYWAHVAATTGMPYPVRLGWMYRSTEPACLAVKAAALQGDGVADAVLRCLREATFVFGEPPDTLDRILGPCRGVRGLDLDRFARDWASEAVRRTFRDDWEETRAPNAYVLELEEQGEGAGRAKQTEGHWRYVFPTLIFRGPRGEVTVPGWKPYERYEEAMDAVAPGVTRGARADPTPEDAFATWPALAPRELEVLCGAGARPPGARPPRARGAVRGGRATAGRGARPRLGRRAVLARRRRGASARPRVTMRVWCVGAGAIGGTVAARLARAGIDPVVVDADPEHVRRLRVPGLRVDGLDGGAVTPLAASTPAGAAALPGSCDALLLAVRSRVTEAALAPLVPRLGPGSDVVSLQNGLNEERIAALVGAERTIGCVVGFAATWIGPGHVELTSPGELVIGRLDGTTDGRLERVAGLLARAFPTRTTDNVVGALWGKMLVNSVTVLGALGGLLLGELIAWNPRVLAHVVAEGVDVAAAEGVRLDDVFGLVPAALVATRGDGWLETVERALGAVGRHFAQVKSVTWRDFELGQPTEVAAVTGEIVRRGAERGVPTPLNAAAYAMLREIEAGARRIGRANLEALAALE